MQIVNWNCGPRTRLRKPRPQDRQGARPVSRTGLTAIATKTGDLSAARRLEARPIATWSVEAAGMHEREERYGAG